MPKHSPRAFFTVHCPYCDWQMKLFRPLSPTTAQEVVYCDSEEGGCDRPFVVFYHADIVASRVAALADELPPPAPIPPAAPDSSPFSPGLLAEEIAEAQVLLAQFEQLAGATDAEHSPLDLLPHDARRTLDALRTRLANVCTGWTPPTLRAPGATHGVPGPFTRSIRNERIE